MLAQHQIRVCERHKLIASLIVHDRSHVIDVYLFSFFFLFFLPRTPSSESMFRPDVQHLCKRDDESCDTWLLFCISRDNFNIPGRTKHRLRLVRQHSIALISKSTVTAMRLVYTRVTSLDFSRTGVALFFFIALFYSLSFNGRTVHCTLTKRKLYLKRKKILKFEENLYLKKKKYSNSTRENYI